jgi:hypothetical protein
MAAAQTAALASLLAGGGGGGGGGGSGGASEPLKRASLAGGVLTKLIEAGTSGMPGVAAVVGTDVFTTWERNADRAATRMLAMLPMPEGVVSLAQAVGDTVFPEMPLLSLDTLAKPHAALGLAIAAALRPAAAGGGGGGEGGAPPASVTALTRVRGTVLAYAVAEALHAGGTYENPTDFYALTQRVCAAAASADARKARVAGRPSAAAGAEHALAAVVMPLMQAVATAMCGWVCETSLIAAPVVVPSATNSFPAAARFVLQAAAFGGVVLTSYTQGTRAMYLSSVGQLDAAWGTPPPLPARGAAPQPRAAAPEVGAAAPTLGSPPVPRLPRVLGAITYPEGYGAPAILVARAPADVEAEVPYGRRSTCWQCGEARDKCPKMQDCGKRGALKVFSLKGAQSYLGAHTITARQAGPAPQAGAKRERGGEGGGGGARRQ